MTSEKNQCYNVVPPAKRCLFKMVGNLKEWNYFCKNESFEKNKKRVLTFGNTHDIMYKLRVTKATQTAPSTLYYVHTFIKRMKEAP